MIKAIQPFLVGCGLFALLLLSSCAGGAGDVLTLTFTPQGCKYDSPNALNSAITIDWIINDDTSQEYVYVLLTLAERKTKSDMQAWLAESTEHPPWANILTYNITGAGNQKISKKHDLTTNASYDGSPVYIICSIGEKVFVEGPVKIKH